MKELASYIPLTLFTVFILAVIVKDYWDRRMK